VDAVWKSVPADPRSAVTVIPLADSFSDSAGNVWSLGEAVPHGQKILCNGVQFAGGQGVLLLYFGQQVYAQNDQGLWFVATASAWHAVPGDPRPPIIMGIDVSYAQGAINWAQVKAGGQAFAFIKASESNDITDSWFATNWRGAKAVGLLRGAYHFYRFEASPQSQADRFLATVGSDRGELPLVVDVEDTNAVKPNLNDVKQFLDIVQQRTGKKCLIYTGSWYWTPQQWGGAVPWASGYDLWVADYGAPPPTWPGEWPTWKFWQYSGSGTASGIATAVDLDYFNGTALDLQAFANAGATPPFVSG
jgi:GH25 family lysozyme M1 (1,4-beta-N-acetylmuramidase)